MDTVSVERIEILLGQMMKALHPPPSRKLGLHNITFAQMRIIWILTNQSNLSMSQLADIIGVSRATISSIVDRLVKSKFVSRIEDEKDRRITRLCLSSSGKKFIQTQNRLRRKRLAKLLGNLSLKKQKELIVHLEELNKLLGSPNWNCVQPDKSTQRT